MGVSVGELEVEWEDAARLPRPIFQSLAACNNARYRPARQACQHLQEDGEGVVAAGLQQEGFCHVWLESPVSPLTVEQTAAVRRA